MLKSCTIEIIWAVKTRKHFIESGYSYTKLGDSFNANVSDLPFGSHMEIIFVCDYCLIDFKRSYRRMLESNKSYTITKDCCDGCFKYKNIEQKLFDYGINNIETLISHLLIDKIDKISGVYKIRNIINGKNYIGSTKNILSRWKDHSNELSKGTHRSHSLTEDYNKYGIDAFEFSILDFNIKKSELVNLEHSRIRGHLSDESDYGYNTVSMFKTNKNKSTNSTILKEIDIIEIKKRIVNKESHRNIAKQFGVTTSVISGIKNGASWNYIKTPYDDDIANSNIGKRAGESNGCSKLTENDIKVIKERLKDGQQLTSIGKEFNVSRTLISYIRSGKLWSHVS